MSRVRRNDRENEIIRELLYLFSQLEAIPRRRAWDYCGARLDGLPVIDGNGRVIAEGLPEAPPLISFIRRQDMESISGGMIVGGADVEQDVS